MKYSSLCLDMFLTKPKMFSFDINTSYLQPVTGFPVNGAPWRDHTASLSQWLPVPHCHSAFQQKPWHPVWQESGWRALDSGLPGPCLRLTPALLGVRPTPLSQVTASFWGRYLYGAHWSRFPLCNKMPNTHTRTLISPFTGFYSNSRLLVTSIIFWIMADKSGD